MGDPVGASPCGCPLPPKPEPQIKKLQTKHERVPMKTPANNQKGFTLIELVVVLVILALLAAVAVPKFFDLQKQAEAASVKAVLGNVKSALSIRMAKGLAEGEDIAELAYDGSNPLDPMGDLLSNKPETYQGVIANSAEPGVWFDDDNAQDDLVYVLKNAGIIDDAGTENSSGDQMRFHIVAISDTINGETVTVGLELQPRDPTSFDWLY